jgi:hypothetical protein
MIHRFGNGARHPLVLVASVSALVVGGFASARAQDTTASDRAYLLEGRLGGTAALGGRTRDLVGSHAAVGVTFAFQISRHSWGWVSADYMPFNWSGYERPDMPPGISMYALTTGVSRAFGSPFAWGPWKPFEVGLGVGATQMDIQLPANIGGTGASPPPDAQLDDLSSSRLLAYRQWRPAAAARLRMALPIGPLRLSATAGLLATYVGDVPLWNGGWEPTGQGSRYRPSSRVWSYGTTFTAPLTVGLGFRF